MTDPQTPPPAAPGDKSAHYNLQQTGPKAGGTGEDRHGQSAKGAKRAAPADGADPGPEGQPVFGVHENLGVHDVAAGPDSDVAGLLAEIREFTARPGAALPPGPGDTDPYEEGSDLPDVFPETEGGDAAGAADAPPARGAGAFADPPGSGSGGSGAAAAGGGGRRPADSAEPGFGPGGLPHGHPGGGPPAPEPAGTELGHLLDSDPELAERAAADVDARSGVASRPGLSEGPSPSAEGDPGGGPADDGPAGAAGPPRRPAPPDGGDSAPAVRGPGGAAGAGPGTPAELAPYSLQYLLGYRHSREAFDPQLEKDLLEQMERAGVRPPDFIRRQAEEFRRDERDIAVADLQERFDTVLRSFERLTQAAATRTLRRQNQAQEVATTLLSLASGLGLIYQSMGDDARGFKDRQDRWADALRKSLQELAGDFRSSVSADTARLAEDVSGVRAAVGDILRYFNEVQNRGRDFVHAADRCMDQFSGFGLNVGRRLFVLAAVGGAAGSLPLAAAVLRSGVRGALQHGPRAPPHDRAVPQGGVVGDGRGADLAAAVVAPRRVARPEARAPGRVPAPQSGPGRRRRARRGARAQQPRGHRNRRPAPPQASREARGQDGRRPRGPLPHRPGARREARGAVVRDPPPLPLGLPARVRRQRGAHVRHRLPGVDLHRPGPEVPRRPAGGVGAGRRHARRPHRRPPPRPRVRPHAAGGGRRRTARRHRQVEPHPRPFLHRARRGPRPAARQALVPPRAAVDPDLVQLDQPSDVFDPLPPADDAVAGFVDIEARLQSAKRVAVYLSHDEALGPTSMTRRQALDLIRRVRDSPEPVILTARVEGSDLVIRTLEIMPSASPRRFGPRRARRAAPSGSSGS